MLKNFDDEKAQDAIKLLLLSLEDNFQGDVDSTSKLISDMYKQFFAISNSTRNRNNDIVSSNGSIILKDISIISICKHHLLPFYGSIDIGYMYNKKIYSFGTIYDILDTHTSKLTLQELLINELLDDIKHVIDPIAVVIKLKCTHTCLLMKRARNASVITFNSWMSTIHNNHIECNRKYQFLLNQLSYE